jgi:predicted nucleic acid-binding protein
MRVFWDTNLFIYLWEDSTARSRMEALVAWQDLRKAEAVTSTLTLGELLMRPMQRRREDLVAHYTAAFAQMHVIEFDRAAAFRFAQLRSAHPKLIAPDAVQLACASTAGVDFFVTNDRRLSRLQVAGIGMIGRWLRRLPCHDGPDGSPYQGTGPRERGFAEMLRLDPRFHPLREDPRFQKLCEEKQHQDRG